MSATKEGGLSLRGHRVGETAAEADLRGGARPRGRRAAARASGVSGIAKGELTREVGEPCCLWVPSARYEVEASWRGPLTGRKGDFSSQALNRQTKFRC